jgi:gliding motility-associated-like protein
MPIYFVGGNDDPRYRFVPTNGTLTILRAEPIYKTYGDAPFDILVTSDVTSYSMSMPGILKLDLVDGKLKAEIVKSGTLIVYIGVSSPIQIPVNVQKAILTATADDKERPQGKENPDFTVTITGFVKGEDKSVITTFPEAECEAKPYFRTGRVKITFKKDEDGKEIIGKADNYEFSFIEGWLTITRGDDLPTAFTPNGDTINDNWPWDNSGYNVKIFNRLGVLIFSGDNGWDGKYKGRYVEPGIYYYISTSPAPENKVDRGTVEVIRTSR